MASYSNVSRPNTKPQTRKDNNIWLVGPTSKELCGKKLPSVREVLSVFFYLHKIEQLTIKESCKQAINMCLPFWEKARIPTCTEIHARERLEKFFQRWKGLQKATSRRTVTQIKKEEEFTADLNKMFDIAHAKALDLITIEEDCAFLLAQRDGRRGFLGSIDKKLAAKEARVAKRKQEEQARTEKAKLTASTVQMYQEDIYVSSSASENEQSCSSEYPSPKKRGRSSITRPKAVISSALAQALDRTKVSDRAAVHVIAATAHSLGHNADELAISRSTIRRSRRTLRQETATSSKANFSLGVLDPGVNFVVHWDGKLLSDTSGSQDKYDRLPVLVSYDGTEKLLSVPKLANASGQSMALEVKKSLDDWKLNDKIVAMSFDTTSSNTGRRKGACHLLEVELEKEILWLACRHHIFELIYGAAFNIALETSPGPDIEIFKHFQERWPHIKKESYEIAASDPSMEVYIAPKRASLLMYANEYLRTQQPREDYREFVELIILFLGGLPNQSTLGVRKPGAFHKARWMSKVLYSLKIWMFRKQLKLSAKQKKGFAEVVLFTVLVYFRAWFNAPVAISAPAHDLAFLKELNAYASINNTISKVACTKFLNHLWYLSEELVALAFFDDNVAEERKKRMVKNLERPGKSIRIVKASLKMEEIDETEIEDFVSVRSMQLFKTLNLSTDFFSLPPSLWLSDESYISGKKKASQLRVVNDTAERGVALIQEYVHVLTKDEEQRQCLLQVVADHRKNFPDATKRTIVAGLQNFD